MAKHRRQSGNIRLGGRRREKKRIGPGSTENNCVGVKIIYGSHLRDCSVIVRPSLI